jgi:fimbrial isopeptide formation D2 family protein
LVKALRLTASGAYLAAGLSLDITYRLQAPVTDASNMQAVDDSGLSANANVAWRTSRITSAGTTSVLPAAEIPAVTVRQVAGRITGRAWQDVNGDGIQNLSEPAVGGVPVSLLDASGQPVNTAANVPVTTATGTDGSYMFLVPLGDYRVQTQAPTGFVFSPVNVTGASPATDSDMVLDSAASVPLHAVGASASVSLTDELTGSGSTGSNVATYLDAGLASIPVTVTKDDGRGLVHPGDTLTYTITVTNLDPMFTVPVTVTDTLPAQLIDASAPDTGLGAGTLSGATLSGGVLAGGTVSWPVTKLLAGDTVTYTLTAKVDPAATPGTQITNTANLSGCAVTTCSATDTDLIPAHFVLPFTGGTGLTNWRLAATGTLALALFVLLALLTFDTAHRTQTRHQHSPRYTKRH